jgi:hypothetical protein
VAAKNSSKLLSLCWPTGWLPDFGGPHYLAARHPEVPPNLVGAGTVAQAVQAGEVASVSRPQRDREMSGRSVMNQGFYALQVFVRGVLIRL